MKLALILPLIACGAQPDLPFFCRSVCGVTLVARAGAWTCDKQQSIEDQLLVDFPHTDDSRLQDPCERMRGTDITIRDVNQFKNPATGNWVLGLTNCTTRQTEINKFTPQEGSDTYAHEMAHVVQGCWPNSCAHTAEDSQHACWDVNGIDEAILRATRSAK